MILLLDVGNTRVKIGWILKGSGQREPTPLALCHAELDRLPAWLDALPATVAQAWGVNVAGDAVVQTIQAAVLRHTSRAIHWVGSQLQAGHVRNAYEVPAQLGADRWLSMIGLAERARNQHFVTAVSTQTPLMLATFGTTTTIDTLGPEQRTRAPSRAGTATDGYAAEHVGERVFEGGLILPGPALMRASLHAGTARLPNANGTCAAYPVHTHQAIVTGITAAQAGAVVRQWRAGVARFGGSPRVFSSGGGWSLVEEETQRLLATAQSDLGLAPEPMQWLSAPALDGLACLATQGQ